MKQTIYLPDRLAERVKTYLKAHKDVTFSSLVQGLLEREVAATLPTDQDWDAFMSLAGIVKTSAEMSDPQRPEDDVVRMMHSSRDV